MVKIPLRVARRRDKTSFRRNSVVHYDSRKYVW